jgi:hypothetical protein
MMLPGALQYWGKLKERVDALFAWMELHQFTFHHPELGVHATPMVLGEKT